MYAVGDDVSPTSLCSSILIYDSNEVSHLHIGKIPKIQLPKKLYTNIESWNLHLLNPFHKYSKTICFSSFF